MSISVATDAIRLIWPGEHGKVQIVFGFLAGNLWSVAVILLEVFSTNSNYNLYSLLIEFPSSYKIRTMDNTLNHNFIN